MDNYFKEAPWGIIPAHWSISTVNEVASLVTDYVANGSFASLSENVKYKETEDEAVLIRLVDYNNKFKSDFVFIDGHAYEFLSKSKLFGGEIIISNVGANVGTVFRCPKLKYKMSLAPNSIMVKFDGDDNFYYYWFKSRYGQHMLQTIVTGSAQPKFNKTNFRSLEIPVPPITEQLEISSILLSIDKKIECNQRINEILEKQAKVLFKSWFVDFKPFIDSQFVDSELGLIPESWEIVKLSDYVENLGGYSYKGTELQPSSIAMATIKNFVRGGGFKTEGYKEIVISKKIKDYQFVNLFDVLVAHTDLTQNAEVIGNPAIILSTGGYEKLIMSMDLTKVIPKDQRLSKPLLHCILSTKKFKEHALGYVNGTTVLHMSKKAVPEFKLAMPKDLDILKELTSMLDSLYFMMSETFAENICLTALRDTLLPKLMSGQIKL